MLATFHFIVDLPLNILVKSGNTTDMNMVLVLESWQKLSNASSIRSLVVDEERMRPGRPLVMVSAVLPSLFRH